MPEIVYNVKFRIKQEQIGTRGVADITAYEREIEKLRNTVDQQAKAVNVAADANRQYNASMKGTSQIQGNANKQIAIGNQLFFSLSDGIQDAAQFSQGFSQGMRAIGNNIGFTAELGASFLTRVRQMNNGMLTTTAVINGLKQSFLGAGGFLLLLNGAITLITMFSNRSKEASKEASKLTDELLNQAKAHRELKQAQDLTNGSLVKGSDEIKSNIEALRNSLPAQESYIKLLEGSNQATIFGIERSEAIEIARENLKRTTEDIVRLEREYGEQKIREVAILGSSVDAAKKEFEQRKLIDENVSKSIVLMANLASSSDKNADALSDMFFEGQKILAFFRSSNLLTADQVLIAKQLEEALYAVSDAFAVLSEPTRPRIAPTPLEDVILGIDETPIVEKMTNLNQIIFDIDKDFEELKLEMKESSLELELDLKERADMIYIESERAKASAVRSINQSLFSSLSSLSSTFAKKNEGLAMTLLVAEKGLRIAQIITNTIKQVSELSTAAITATALGNPLAAASATGAIPFVKASAAASIAAIIATGIGQASSISGAGGGGGGGARGGGRGKAGSAPQMGFSTSERQSPTFTPLAQQQKPQVVLNATAKIDRRGLALLVRDGEGQLQSTSIITTSA